MAETGEGSVRSILRGMGCAAAAAAALVAGVLGKGSSGGKQAIRALHSVHAQAGKSGHAIPTRGPISARQTPWALQLPPGQPIPAAPALGGLGSGPLRGSAPMPPPTIGAKPGWTANPATKYWSLGPAIGKRMEDSEERRRQQSQLDGSQNPTSILPNPSPKGSE